MALILDAPKNCNSQKYIHTDAGFLLQIHASGNHQIYNFEKDFVFWPVIGNEVICRCN